MKATGRWKSPAWREIPKIDSGRIEDPLIGLKAHGPGTLDVCDDVVDFRLGKGSREGRHVAAIAGYSIGVDAVSDQFIQLLVGMLPGVAACIVRRRWEIAVLTRTIPVNLPFQMHAVATCAIPAVELSPCIDLGRLDRRSRRGKAHERHDDDQGQHNAKSECPDFIKGNRHGIRLLSRLARVAGSISSAKLDTKVPCGSMT